MHINLCNSAYQTTRAYARVALLILLFEQLDSYEYYSSMYLIFNLCLNLDEY